MTKEITIRCNCGDHKFLTLWKDDDFLPDSWELTYSRHYMPFWRNGRLRYALKLIFRPYSLSDWEDFIISDKDMKKIIKKVQE